jgi:ketosteroid isomerase-like protein
MSQKNMEIVRRSVEHINRTGEPAWDLFDPEITFRTRGDIESSSTYRGYDGLREAVAGFAGVWDSVRWEIQDVIGDGDTLVVAFHIYLRGKGSGVELETNEAWACWIRDGKYVRIEQHGKLEEALEAAGLRE